MFINLWNVTAIIHLKCSGTIFKTNYAALPIAIPLFIQKLNRKEQCLPIYLDRANAI